MKVNGLKVLYSESTAKENRLKQETEYQASFNSVKKYNNRKFAFEVIDAVLFAALALACGAVLALRGFSYTSALKFLGLFILGIICGSDMFRRIDKRKPFPNKNYSADVKYYLATRKKLVKRHRLIGNNLYMDVITDSGTIKREKLDADFEVEYKIGIKQVEVDLANNKIYRPYKEN